MYGRDHVRSPAIDLHVETRRHLIRGGAGHGQVRPFQLGQAGHAVMGYPAHVHARLVVVERVAPELLGRQTQILAPVYGGHVFEYRVHRLQQFSVQLREVAHLRLLDHAVRLHVVHDVRRPVVDGWPSGHGKPVHVVQITVAGLLVEIN